LNFEPYPFEKLNKLLENLEPNPDLPLINLTIGEPQMETAPFIQTHFALNSDLLKKYPKSSGEEYLKDSMLNFMKKRFNLELSQNELIPTFGTREVLFNFPQFLLFEIKKPFIAFTNPFYQIYEGSAKVTNSEVFYLNLTEENNFKPEIPSEDILKKLDFVILNFPNNPTGSVLSFNELKQWIELSQKYDFVLLNDECYSEIYTTSEKPLSLLEVAHKIGITDFNNLLVVNSISKRSSAPGLRSGFIAGDQKILNNYKKYRTYLGTAIPLPLQIASAKAWNDEVHVVEIRKTYAENRKLAEKILKINVPENTFYIWLKVNNDLKTTQELYSKYSIKVLAGRFLGRDKMGENFIRIALVEQPEKTKIALERLKEFLKLNKM
jgi:aspartate/methionine/tyrosine aminotransferase